MINIGNIAEHQEQQLNLRLSKKGVDILQKLLDGRTFLKAISLWQPWASWVALGLKTIETRKHSRFKNLVGKRIVIQAAKRWDKTAYYQNVHLADVLKKEECPLGVILCTVFVKDFRILSELDSSSAMCDCSGNDLYGLILEDIIRFDTPILFKGQQGIFNVPREALPPTDK